jgi:hypothetical protein
VIRSTRSARRSEQAILLQASMSLRLLRLAASVRPLSVRQTSSPKRSFHGSASGLGQAGATVNADEISHFSRLSSEWWDERGEFSFLHQMNPVRVRFIQEKLAEIATDDSESGELVNPATVLRGLNVLDVGCGGGLLSEVSGPQLVHNVFLNSLRRVWHVWVPTRPA